MLQYFSGQPEGLLQREHDEHDEHDFLRVCKVIIRLFLKIFFTYLTRKAQTYFCKEFT